MKLNYRGCAICDSTWGDIREEVDGTRLFFCCPICAIQFRHLVERVKASTGWDRIDALEIAGDRRGRACVATRGDREFRFEIAFNSDGEVRRFRPAPERVPG